MDEEGGDAACWLGGVCDECGALIERNGEHRCVRAARLGHVDPGPGPDGVVWSLGGARQLEVNLVVLGPAGGVGDHVNTAVDVVIVVLEGSATVLVDGVARPLAEHDLLLVPPGARRSVVAGTAGARYLSIHASRPGPTIEH